MSTASGLRVDNAMVYQSPDIEGFQAGVLHSLQAVNNEVPGRGNDLNPSGTRIGAGAKSWMAGITAPVGNGILRSSYQTRDGEALGGENRDLRVISLGYEYFFSKRTSAYAVVADSDGKGTRDNNPGFDRRQYTVGLMHKF
jgi:predicted porin